MNRGEQNCLSNLAIAATIFARHSGQLTWAQMVHPPTRSVHPDFCPEKPYCRAPVDCTLCSTLTLRNMRFLLFLRDVSRYFPGFFASRPSSHGGSRRFESRAPICLASICPILPRQSWHQRKITDVPSDEHRLFSKGNTCDQYVPATDPFELVVG